MILKLRHRWNEMRTSFWFIPVMLVLGATLLATGLIALDMKLEIQFDKRWPLLFGAGEAGSRGLLTAVASSMITVAGVVFSITIVALSLTSSQYTSRVLRNFMRDRMTQTVLGVFLGIFIYCLVVLRTIRGGEEGAFVPSLAVLGGLALAFVGVGVLIYFIHHIAMSIQASSLIAEAAEETIAAIDRLFPSEMGDDTDNEADGESTTPAGGAAAGGLDHRGGRAGDPLATSSRGRACRLGTPDRRLGRAWRRPQFWIGVLVRHQPLAGSDATLVVRARSSARPLPLSSAKRPWLIESCSV